MGSCCASSRDEKKIFEVPGYNQDDEVLDKQFIDKLNVTNYVHYDNVKYNIKYGGNKRNKDDMNCSRSSKFNGSHGNALNVDWGSVKQQYNMGFSHNHKHASMNKGS